MTYPGAMVSSTGPAVPLSIKLRVPSRSRISQVVALAIYPLLDLFEFVALVVDVGVRVTHPLVSIRATLLSFRRPVGFVAGTLERGQVVEQRPHLRALQG